MKKEKFIKDLGLRARMIRQKKSISLYRLGKITNKEPRSIQRFEKGEISASLYYLSEIAAGLEVSLEELVKGIS